jgi:hypothetical protein
MDFTLATLEDGLGNLSPTDDQIKNYIETLPKDRTLNILNKLPNHIRKEYCGNANIQGGGNIKENLPAIGIGGAVAGSVGYYIGGVGGAVVGGLIGALAGYYAKDKGMV